jgi:phage terminase|nr:MAG TPA: Terminase large subunit [Caudoviricetes sp.]
MAECRPKNYPKLKNYKPSRFMLPTCHYDAAKADRAVTFIENLRHTKGKWAGKRFWLLPWQEQIIRDVFGIVDERGNRQFRTAYVEIGKKNGKSELAAAVALYLLFADNEPSAEVYALGYLYEHRDEADHHQLMLTLRSILFAVREGVF